MLGHEKPFHKQLANIKLILRILLGAGRASQKYPPDFVWRLKSLALLRASR